MSNPRNISTRSLRVALVSSVLALGLLGLAAGSASASSSIEPGTTASSPGPTPRIIGGDVAPPGSWPSQAALLFAAQPDAFQAQFCGGTLIRPTWVLTAAHCVDFLSSPSELEVAVGINDLNDVLPSDREAIEEIYIHPGWDPDTNEWDFALLELGGSSAQPTMDLISPAEAGEITGGKPARIAGWGCTLQVPKSECPTLPGGFPNQLLQANVQFVSDANCGSVASYGSEFIPEMMICAGLYPAGGRDTCFGDSGGPATATVGSRQVLAGVTSWGSAICGIVDKPGVFARVTAGLPWITSTIGPEPEARIGSITVSGPSKVKRGKTVTYKASIANTGTATATGVRLGISGRGVSVNTSVGSIAAGATRTVSIRAKFRTVGKLRAIFRATSTNAGSKQTAKTIRVVR